MCHVTGKCSVRVRLFERNWALHWSTYEASGIPDHTCLHPPRNMRYKCSVSRQRLVHVVAFVWVPLGNLALHRYISKHLYEAQTTSNTSDSDDGSAQIGVRCTVGPPKPPTFIGESGASGRSGSHHTWGRTTGTGGMLSGAAALASVLLSTTRLAMMPQSIDDASAADALLNELGRSSVGSAIPVKKRKVSSFPPLVCRPMRATKRTGAPPEQLDVATEPYIPMRGSHMGGVAERFVLRTAVAVARKTTATRMMRARIIISSTRVDCDTPVGVATRMKWTVPLQNQHGASLLPPVDSLKSSSTRRHDLHAGAINSGRRSQTARACLKLAALGIA